MRERTEKTCLARYLPLLLVAAGAWALIVCACIMMCTVTAGYPNLFGIGYALDDGRGELPEDTLVIFSAYGDESPAKDDFAVYRTVYGMATGRVVFADEDRVAMRAGEDSVTVIPRSAVLGRAYAHSPSAGKVIAALAGAKTFGLAAGLAVAFAGVISMGADALGAVFLPPFDLRRKKTGRHSLG